MKIQTISSATYTLSTAAPQSITSRLIRYPSSSPSPELDGCCLDSSSSSRSSFVAERVALPIAAAVSPIRGDKAERWVLGAVNSHAESQRLPIGAEPKSASGSASTSPEKRLQRHTN